MKEIFSLSFIKTHFLLIISDLIKQYLSVNNICLKNLLYFFNALLNAIRSSGFKKIGFYKANS